MVVIKSKLVEYRGNSWNFECPKERIYFKAESATADELTAAFEEAERQYEGLGWGKCFVEPPKVYVTKEGEV